MSVAAGSFLSLALTAEGALFSFGDGADGQLGHGDMANQPLPKRVLLLTTEGLVSVAAGEYYSLALTAEGALFSFGRGAEDRLGHGTDVADQLQPKRVAALSL